MEKNTTIPITEKSITKAIYWHLVWKMGYQVVTHQFDNYFGKADIFAVNKSLFTHEMEIKVTKADFLSEMNDIEKLCNGTVGLPADRGSKYIKHYNYLVMNKWLHPNQKKMLPNYFSFVVPEELVSFASEKLRGTQYGLMEARYSAYSGRFHFRTIMKAKLISKDKIDFDTLLKLAHRMSYICEKFIDTNF